MRKEIIFAVIFGIIFGTVVALGFMRANKAIKDTAEVVVTNLKDNDDNNVDPQRTTGLSLIKPVDHQVIVDNRNQVFSCHK